MQPILVTFAAVPDGPWRIADVKAVTGDGLARAPALAITEGCAIQDPPASSWVLRGITSNVRYTTRSELDALSAAQEGLGRPQATRAALIPIRKSPAWWALAQEERRAIMEEQSRHIKIGMEYLPAVARRLHHCRDLLEPFDFITWFEYAPDQANAFEELVGRLRETEEWRYVEREIDVRLVRRG